MEKPPVHIDANKIGSRVQELGQQITEDQQGRPLILVGILKGSFIFAADLARAIDVPVTVDFIGLRSYGSETESSGVVQITSDLGRSIEGHDVVIVEDIVDTGLTMDYLIKNLETRNPRSVRLASLLHKPSRARVDITIDYLGFSIDDVFVVGYGMDFNEQYRNLPYLGLLESGGALDS